MDWLLLIAIAADEEKRSKSYFKKRIHLIHRRLRDRRISRRALLAPAMSAFSTMFGSGCERSLVTFCGLNHHGFDELMKLFQPVYDTHTPYSSDGRIARLTGVGRPRSMTASHCLGLCLAWMRCTGSSHNLCAIFGITGSVCSLYLRFGRRILVRVLRRDARAAVQMPNNDEIQSFKEAFQKRHNLLADVYCVCDGLKLKLQQAGNVKIQTKFYNGWMHDHFVSNVLVFAHMEKL